MAVKSKATPAKKSKAKSTGKLARFFGKPRNVIILVFIVGFGLVGGYKVYQSSADTPGTGYKSSANAATCYAIAVGKGTSVWLRYGSEGGCVNTFGKSVNAINAYVSGTNWSMIEEPNIYFYSEEKNAAIGFQKYAGIEASGTVGPQTWEKLVTICANTPAARSACGF